MQALKQDGLAKVLQGRTDVIQAVRYASDFPALSTVVGIRNAGPALLACARRLRSTYACQRTERCAGMALI
jgi:hypothetical protein